MIKCQRVIFVDFFFLETSHWWRQWIFTKIKPLQETLSKILWSWWKEVITNKLTKRSHWVGRWQSNKHLTINEGVSKIARDSVFHCHLSPVGRQKAFEKSISRDSWSTFLDSINGLYCRLFGVNVHSWHSWILSCFFVVCWFFSNILYRKILSGIPSECQIV